MIANVSCGFLTYCYIFVLHQIDISLKIKLENQLLQLDKFEPLEFCIRVPKTTKNQSSNNKNNLTILDDLYDFSISRDSNNKPQDNSSEFQSLEYENLNFSYIDENFEESNYDDLS
ncbi:9274_t:CDS:2 [Scutellospora calospora]|uniref:9274_t:CDS:1 n=1 Tax=Scutellospora calospora TaxID=85575 RepID=A0ACA9LFG4_9GLOM|nr:9274_t:CDS:2 [Scutellospora calospora]